MVEFKNVDCIEYMKSIPDNSIPLVITNIELTNLDKIYKILSLNGTCWFYINIFDIKNILNIPEKYGFINHLENSIVLTTKNKTYHYFHLTKSNNYTWNNIEIKRDVVVPYTIKGKNGEKIKRGWDYENGNPKRWTSIGNCIYIENFFDIFSIFQLLSSNENDKVLLYPENKLLKRNYSKLYNQISTSENCELSFNKRKFLPKEI